MSIREKSLREHGMFPLAGKVPQAPALVVPVSEVAPPMRFKICITASVSGTGARRASEFIEGPGQDVARQMADRHTVIDDKNSVALFSAGVIRGDLPPGESVSTKEALAGVQLVVLDLDSPSQTEVDHVQTALKASGLVFLMYPTHSWAPDAPRWRVVVLLSRVVPVERYAALWAGLGRQVGTYGDESAKKPAQRYYLPSCPIGQKDFRPVAIVGGTGLADPDELDPPALMQDVSVSPARTYNASINAEFMAPRQREDNRTRDAVVIAAQCLVVGDCAAGADQREPDWLMTGRVLYFCHEGEAIFHKWSALNPKYDSFKTQKKYDIRPANIGPPRCGTSPRCADCKHNGVISSPVQLGDSNGTAAGKQPVDIQKAIGAALQAADIKAIMDRSGQLFFVKNAVVNGRTERTVTPAESQAATDAVTAATLAATGKAVSKSAIETALAVTRHTARESGERVDICLRVAETNGTVWRDCGLGRVARITCTGWGVVDDAAEGVPIFMRGATAGEIPDPVSIGTPRAALVFLLDSFKKLQGLPGDEALIVIATLLEWCRTATPHPIIEIVGPAGCGKSTLSDAIAALIDPAGDGGRVTVGTAGPDIAAAAQHAHLLRLDNAGRLDVATSNLLCIVSTGGTLMMRLLYSQGETANLKVHRAMLINAVSPVCTAPDLQTRVILIERPARRDGYVSEGGLRSSWNALLPSLQGALNDLMVGVLRELPSVRESGAYTGHRLVDFDQLGVALVRSAGLEDEKFTKPVGKMRERMARRTASGDLFLMALIRVLRDLAARPTHAEHVDVAAVARGMNPALGVVAYDGSRIRITVKPETLHQRMPLSVGFERNSAMPATPRGLTDAIRRVQPMLSGTGVNVDELNARGRCVLRFDFDLGAVHED